jgi:predicted RND superfamily exporter protein
MMFLLEYSVSHARQVVLLVVALVVAAGFHIPDIDLSLDGRSLIPSDDPSMEASDAAAARFALRDVIVLGVLAPPPGVCTPAGLDLVARLSGDLERLEGVEPSSVASVATLPRLFIEGDTLDLRPLISRSPDLDAETAARVCAEVRTLGLDDGVVVSATAQAAAIYARLEPTADRRRVLSQIEALASSRRIPGFEVPFSGSALAQAELGEAALGDLARLVPVAIVVVSLVLFAAFRTPIPILVSLTEVGTSLILTGGLMGLLSLKVFVTTLSLPIVVLVIGVSDDVYGLHRYYRHPSPSGNERDRRERIVQAFGPIRRPILLTTATTVAGLLALATTRIEPQRVFGMFGAVAVALSTLLTFTLVPALLVLLEKGHAASPRREPRYGESGARLVLRTIERRSPAAILAVVAGVALAALVASSGLRIEDSWIANLPPWSPVVTGDRRLNDAMAGTNTLELMIDSGQTGGFLDPRLFAGLGSLREALRSSPDVGAVVSPYEEVLRIRAALRGTTLATVEREASRRPLDPQELEQALLLLDSRGLSPGERRLDDERQRARITVFIRGANYSRTAAIIAVARARVREVFGELADPIPFGDGWIGFNTVRLLVTGQIASIGVAAVGNFALLMVLFRSLGTALLASAPIAAAVLVVFGALASTGTALGTASSMFAAIALGIGVDYSIHLVATYQARLADGLPPAQAVRDALAQSGPPILTTAAAMGVGLAVLGFSRVGPNRDLGLLVAFSTVLCAILSVLLIPAITLYREHKQ